MNSEHITAFDYREMELALASLTTVFRQNGFIKKSDSLHIELFYTDEWVQKCYSNERWINILAEQINRHWKAIPKAHAIAAILNHLLNTRTYEVAMLLTQAAVDRDTFFSLSRNLDKVSPEFSKDMQTGDAGPTDIVLRMTILNLLSADPTSPSDTFLVDAVARAYHEMFKVSADDVFMTAAQSMAGMPDNATGFALVLAGCKGFFEIWLHEPSERSMKILTDFVDKNFEITEDEDGAEDFHNAIRAATTVLCMQDFSLVSMTHLLSASAKILGIPGMLIVADPLAEDGEEASDSSAFIPLEGDTLLEIHADIMSRPSVQQFVKDTELLEEIKSSFNDRLLVSANGAMYED